MQECQLKFQVETVVRRVFRSWWGIGKEYSYIRSMYAYLLDNTIGSNTITIIKN